MLVVAWQVLFALVIKAEHFTYQTRHSRATRAPAELNISHYSLLVQGLPGSSLIGRLEAMDGSAEEPVSWQEGDQPATSSSCGYQHFNPAG